MGYIAILILAREVVARLEDDKGRNRPSGRVDALDNRGPLSIAWLDSLRPSTSP